MAKVFNETLNETNDMESPTISYTSLALMVIVPLFSAFDRPIRQRFFKKMKIILQVIMSSKYKMVIPLIFSGIFFTIFFILNVPFTNVFSQVIYLIDTFYVTFGVRTLNNILSIEFRAMIPDSIFLKTMYRLEFLILDILCHIMCGAFGSFYTYSKHWISNHIFAFAIVISRMNLSYNIKSGYIFLYGLFIYNIYWQYNTNVIFTVVQSYDVYIKVLCLIYIGIRKFKNFIQLWRSLNGNYTRQ